MSEQRTTHRKSTDKQRNSWNSLWVPTHSSQKPSILVINRLNQESDSNWSRRKEAKRVSFPKRTTRSSRNSRNTRVEARPSSLLSSGWCNKVIGPFKICVFSQERNIAALLFMGRMPLMTRSKESIWNTFDGKWECLMPGPASPLENVETMSTTVTTWCRRIRQGVR